MDPSRILTTGGSGRLGSALSKAGTVALERGVLDICDTRSIAHSLDTHEPGLVINTAAYTAVDQAEAEPERAFAINRDGTANLARACADRNLPLIHISTDCVFGDGDPNQPVNEHVSPEPLSVYGRSKYEGEQAILASDARACIVRVAWLFNQQPDTFIGKILNAAEHRDALTIVNDAYGRPTPVNNLASTLIQLAARMLGETRGLPAILHLGPPAPVSRLGWAEEIFTHAQSLGRTVPRLAPCASDAFPETARRPRGLIMDVGTSTDLMGEMPDWRPACARAVQTLLSRQ